MRHLLAAAGMVVALGATHARAATVQIINADGVNEGFNATAAFTPVGGNPATTLGQARLNAFQYAANLWAECLESDVTIRVYAQMNGQTCGPTSAVLGSAGAISAFRDFAGAPSAGTWYPVALANSIVGVDLDPGALPENNDISAVFNSNLNGNVNCLGGSQWYYGYDASPPPGDLDFVSVVLHEIGHGLGFQTYHNLTTGAYLADLTGPYPDHYLRRLERAAASPSLYTDMSDAQRAAANKSDPNLRWNGSSVTAAQVLIPVTAGLNGGKVRMHGPITLAPGSSVSHFSTAVVPNELMEPAYTGPNHNVSLALPLMEDIGWVLANKCPPEITTVSDTDTATVSQTLATWDLQIEVTNTGTFNALNVTATLSESEAWLSVIDATCAYPDLVPAASSLGLDSYSLDITSWPGGPFTVDVLVEWDDICGNHHSQNVSVDLEPATISTPVGGGAYAYRLNANVPNPFNPSTTIEYQMADAGRATLRVYDVSGRLVKTLVDRTHVAGTFDVRWDGRDDRGRAVASGVYFYRLQANGFTQTRRMVLLK